MPVAAVPTYLGTDFQHASPGMRFGMYLTLWQRGSWSKSKDKPLDHTKKLNANDQKTMQALFSRQQQAFDALASADTGLRLDARSIAPFTTGLGNEHPLENGFAFLNPYGLPYLPGSGVKGVLRQAARELASGEWGEKYGWSEAPRYELEVGNKTTALSLLDVLLGRETPEGDTDHVRGALSFWDVIPQIKGDSLLVEIMTPHQSHYYQQTPNPKSGGSVTPHDSGQPTPIAFLTVPPESRFTFHVVCDHAHLNRLAPDLADLDPATGKPRWQSLITAALEEHAFAWLGFGAKTAVGYGAMQRMSEAQVAADRQRADADRLRCDWVDEVVGELARKNRAPESDTLRSKGLAERWSALTDADLKARALADIRARWMKEGWWDSPQGSSAKKAKAIYEAGT